MNAKEAKELAQKNTKAAEEKRKIKTQELKNADTNLLYNHLHDKIDEAVAQGKLSTESAGITIKFPDNRFENEVIADVVNMLRQQNYQVHKEHHNAYKEIKFFISWV